MIRITKPVSIILEGKKQGIHPGQIIDLDRDKSARLVAAGYAEYDAASTDPFSDTMTTFGQLDPGGECWPWILSTHPELWRQHIKALRSGDLANTNLTFSAMLQTWNTHHAAERRVQ